MRKSNTALSGVFSSVYAALLLSAYLLCVPGAGYTAMVEFKYTLFMALTGAYALAMLVAAFAARRRARLDAASVAAALYLAFTALSALLSPYGAATTVGGTRRDGLLSALAYVVIFILLSRNLRPTRLLLYIFAASVTVFCGVALLQMRGYNPLGLYPGALRFSGANIEYAGVYIGTLGNADIGCAVLCAAVPAFVMGAIRRRHRFELLLLLPAALSVYVTYRCGVSGALLAMAAAVLLLLPVAARGKRAKTAAAFAVFAAAALLIVFLWAYRGRGWGALFQASELLHGRASDSFGSGRLYIWRQVAPLAAERPLFGGGPDTLALRGLAGYEWLRGDGAVMTSLITAAHCEYLNILVNQGVFALAAYVCLLVMSAVRWYKNKTSAGAIAGAACAGYLVHAVFGVSMCINAPYLWLALAIVNADSRACRQAAC